MSNIFTNPQVIPRWLKAQGVTFCFAYTGPSMRPTLQPGNLLYVRPLTHDIGPGDVIVFEESGRNDRVVHRVVAITKTGFITRGDNNLLKDPWRVSPHHIVGRVEITEEGGHFKQVKGGRWELWKARIRWGRVWVWSKIARLLHPFYRRLCCSSRIHRIFHQWFSRYTTIVTVNTPSGPIIKTLYKGYTVACWYPHQNRFECRRPFDLVLPHPKNKEKIYE